MKRPLMFALLCLQFLPALACLNVYGYTLTGERMYTEYFLLSPKMAQFDQGELKRREMEVRKKIAGAPGDFKEWSNLAVVLMKQGRSDTAVRILEPLQKEHPEEYSLAANLGTAYELQGQVDKALEFIRKGIELNPKAHLSSEWVHVLILEARQKGQGGNENSWLRRNPIISPQDFEKQSEGYSPGGNRRVFLELSYQIRTRAPFSPAPNEVMRNLLECLGDFSAEHGTYENAVLCYAYAIRYGEPASESLGDLLRFERSGLKQKLARLNQKRAEVLAERPLPEFFLTLLKRGDLDPGLITEGLDEFAITREMIQAETQDLRDSLGRVKGVILQLDSVNRRQVEHISALQARLEEGRSQGWIFLGIGLLAGLGGIGWSLFRRRRA